jgi:hypothetical protein
LYDWDSSQNGAFYGSGRDCSITFPPKLQAIGAKVFYGMDFASDTLTKLPTTLESIGDYAFAYTESRNDFKSNYVEEIIIPANVTTIGKYAFNDLTVENVYFRGTPESIGANAFEFETAYKSDGTRLQTNIYVPWAQGAGPSLGVTNSYTTIHYNYK